MTRARVTAQQLTRPPKSARLVRGVVSAVSPLTVQIAGGAAVGGIPIPGAVYTVGGAVLVLVQEPGVGPVYPIPGATASTGALAYVGTVTGWANTPSVLTRLGPLVSLKLSVTLGATPPAIGATFATLPTGFRPAASVYARALLYNNGWNQGADVEVRADGAITVNGSTVALAANYGLFLNVTYTAA